MAHDGMGVPALTRAHDEHRTPHVAIWVVTVPMIIIMLVPVLEAAAAPPPPLLLPRRRRSCLT